MEVMQEPQVEVGFISYIVASITGDPDCFSVETSLDQLGVLITLSVDEPQLGRVIGRNGDTAKAIRSLLKALGMANGARYSLKITNRAGHGL